MNEYDLSRSVFVPGLMGAGILLSAGILLADGVRRVLPTRGVRRRVVVARGVRAVVAGAARAAGMEARTQELVRREPRAWWAYLLAGTVLGSIAGLAIRVGTDTYNGAGRLERNPWSLWIGDGFGAIFGFLAALAFLLVMGGHRRRPLRSLVEGTWVGRLRPPPEDRHERAHLLVPEFAEEAEHEIEAGAGEGNGEGAER